MQIATCVFYCAPLMSEPSHKSEMETQILFGESVEVLDSKGNWMLVRALWDNYEGWMLRQQAVDVENYVESSLINIAENAMVTNRNGNISNVLPWGANFTKIKNNEFAIGDNNYFFNAAVPPISVLDSEKTMLIAFAKEFLNVPYMWGGRTHAGIDCSGFSAIIYKLFGVPLKHDASWQMQQGETVDFLQNALPGDLAFFDNAEGIITHVGILIDAQTIIHATETAGGVTIDDMDTQGIISRTSKKHSHNLRIIKRLL